MIEEQFLKYDFLLNAFKSRLEILEHLNDVLPKLYLEFLEAEKEKFRHIQIPENELQKIQNAIEFVKNNDFDNMEKEMQNLSVESLKLLGEGLGFTTKKFRTFEFLWQMTIIYLITSFEDYLKKVLKLAYYYHRETLRSGKMLTYESIVDLQTYDAIIEKIIDQKSNEFIDRTIEELGEKLEQDFHFPLFQESDWRQFTEVFNRRHVIVHNNGWADEKYNLKTGNNTKESLVPTEEYVKNTLILFKEYSQKIHTFFSAKYPDS